LGGAGRAGRGTRGRALLSAAGIGRWIVDPGYGTDRVTPTATLATWSGAPSSEVVRLEALGKDVVASGTSPDDYPSAFRARLADREPDVLGPS
jgi:uncharacterized protein